MQAAEIASWEIEKIATIGGLMLGGMFIIWLTICVVCEERRKLAQTREFEQSRREIAAYVAEGTVAPDDAARLLEPGRPMKQRIMEKVMGKA